MNLLLNRRQLVASPALLAIGQTQLVRADSAVERGDRSLGISITTPAGDDYGAAYDLAVSVGMNRTSLTQDWNILEPESGQYDLTFPQIANAFYPAQNMPIDLSISPISTNQLVMPADMDGRRFNDPELISRFTGVVAAVLDAMPDVDIPTISIGTEPDVYLGNDPDVWSDYSELFEAAAAQVRLQRPEIEIACDCTFDNRVGPNRNLFEAIDLFCDVYSFTYYWLDSSIQARDPAIVTDEFARLANEFSDKPVHFSECGYPSAELCNSSLEQQAEWLRAIFVAWDEYQEAIPRITLVWMHDLDPDAVSALTSFYGVEDPAFAAYLGSIGLRTFANTDKPVWQALDQETGQRNWQPG